MPDNWVDAATAFHHAWINVLLLLVALHVLAALAYLVWKRQNLIGAMFTGRKPLDDVVEPGEPPPALSFTLGPSGHRPCSLPAPSSFIASFG